MTVSTVGRNDPCPCASGKKFKHCCLGKDKGAVSTQKAASEAQTLRQTLAGRQFSSLEEAQAFATQHAQQQNQRPREEFHGLSPEQMRQILHVPFDSPELIYFPARLDTSPTAPILKLFSLLIDAMGERGLKPTAKGNLPRNFCREAALAYWGEEACREHTRFGAINREEDFSELHVARLVAGLAGLIRKYKGRFILSRDCRRLSAGEGAAAIYPRLFKSYVQEFNWAYRDGYPELRFIQSAFLFTLYLLTRYGDTWRPQGFYENAFLRAFPVALSEVPPNPFMAPEDTVHGCYTLRTLVHFVDFLGLAAVEPRSKDLLNREYRVKALPLLGEVVKFQFTGSGHGEKT